MTKKVSLLALGVVIALAVFYITTIAPNLALGDVVTDVPTHEGQFQEYTFFATSTDQTSFATTTSATSTNIATWTNSQGRVDNGYFVVNGAKRVTFYFSRGDTTGEGNTGSSEFSVEASPDGENWYDFERLLQVDSNKTSTSSVTISAATSTTVASLDLVEHNFFAVRCIVVETTDGEHSCSATASY